MHSAKTWHFPLDSLCEKSYFCALKEELEVACNNFHFLSGDLTLTNGSDRSAGRMESKATCLVFYIRACEKRNIVVP